MKLSRIHVQQTHISFSNRSKEDIQREMDARKSGTINQISVLGCRFDDSLPVMPEIVEFLVVRKCSFLERPILEVFGASLKIVELQYCKLTQFPVFHSESINKINVSHNLISEILQLKNKSLRLLDIRNNVIVRITRDIYANNLTVLHEYLFKKGEKNSNSLPLCLRPCVIDMKKIANQSLKGWNNTELIETCQQIIDNNNSVLLGQMLPYLTEEFILKIFKIAKMKRKHSIVSLLIKEQDCEPPEDDQALELLMPEYISQLQLVKVGLATIVKIISTYNNDKERVATFLLHLTQVQGSRNFFIQSQKDLIHYMNLNLTFPHPYQADFLLTQLAFFNDYEFANHAILKYLLHLESLKLIKALLLLPAFNDQMFALGLYKKLLKTNKKLYKILLKQDDLYQKAYTYKNDPYFPEYRQRKSFCLKNDLYDYDILSEYQQMQCSYSRKDLKYTLKFCKKQNEVSVAKRIETHLKKKCLKNLQIRRSNYSSIQSSSQS